jgi:hypothetical protein
LRLSPVFIGHGGGGFSKTEKRPGGLPSFRTRPNKRMKKKKPNQKSSRDPAMRPDGTWDFDVLLQELRAKQIELFGVKLRRVRTPEELLGEDSCQ